MIVRPDLLTARFSIQEAIGHLILLEDHLHVPDRRCGDCIRKHLWTAYAFLQEAHGLPGTPEDRKLLLAAICALRRAWRLLDAGCERSTVAEVLRKSRKVLLPAAGTPELCR